MNLKVSGKFLMTSKRTTAEFSLRHTMFVWRTRNVWCLELIPAELEAFTEAVYDVQADNSRVFFKADLLVWRTKNVSSLELIPAELEDLLNQHLNVSATTWTVIPVLKLITKQLFLWRCVGPARTEFFWHWENKMQLQIINNIQRLIKYVLTISKTFRLESEETEYLMTNYFPFYLKEKCCGTRNWCNSTKVSTEEKARGKRKLDMTEVMILAVIPVIKLIRTHSFLKMCWSCMNRVHLLWLRQETVADNG